MHANFLLLSVVDFSIIGSSPSPGMFARQNPGTDSKGKSKGKGKGKGNGKGNGNEKDIILGASAPDPRPADQAAKGKGKHKGKGTGKGKSESREATQSKEDQASRPDPKGPNVAPGNWKDNAYDAIPIVQHARPSDDYVAAYVQGTSDIPTFRVEWITSTGTTKRGVQVSPNRFKDTHLWSTPNENADFWSPCHDGQHSVTLTPGDDDCCRMCPNTDAEELILCSWCNSWAHYRCTYAVGPRRACASHFKVCWLGTSASINH